MWNMIQIRKIQSTGPLPIGYGKKRMECQPCFGSFSDAGSSRAPDKRLFRDPLSGTVGMLMTCV